MYSAPRSLLATLLLIATEARTCFHPAKGSWNAPRAAPPPQARSWSGQPWLLEPGPTPVPQLPRESGGQPAVAPAPRRSCLRARREVVRGARQRWAASWVVAELTGQAAPHVGATGAAGAAEATPGRGTQTGATSASARGCRSWYQQPKCNTPLSLSLPLSLAWAQIRLHAPYKNRIYARTHQLECESL